LCRSSRALLAGGGHRAGLFKHLLDLGVDQRSAPCVGQGLGQVSGSRSSSASTNSAEPIGMTEKAQLCCASGIDTNVRPEITLMT
jgi:hypothetical protein